MADKKVKAVKAVKRDGKKKDSKDKDSDSTQVNSGIATMVAGSGEHSPPSDGSDISDDEIEYWITHPEDADLDIGHMAEAIANVSEVPDSFEGEMPDYDDPAVLAASRGGLGGGEAGDVAPASAASSVKALTALPPFKGFASKESNPRYVLRVDTNELNRAHIDSRGLEPNKWCVSLLDTKEGKYVPFTDELVKRFGPKDSKGSRNRNTLVLNENALYNNEVLWNEVLPRVGAMIDSVPGLVATVDRHTARKRAAEDRRRNVYAKGAETLGDLSAYVNKAIDKEEAKAKAANDQKLADFAAGKVDRANERTPEQEKNLAILHDLQGRISELQGRLKGDSAQLDYVTGFRKDAEREGLRRFARRYAELKKGLGSNPSEEELADARDRAFKTAYGMDISAFENMVASTYREEAKNVLQQFHAEEKRFDEEKAQLSADEPYGRNGFMTEWWIERVRRKLRDKLKQPGLDPGQMAELISQANTEIAYYKTKGTLPSNPKYRRFIEDLWAKERGADIAELGEMYEQYMELAENPAGRSNKALHNEVMRFLSGEERRLKDAVDSTKDEIGYQEWQKGKVGDTGPEYNPPLMQLMSILESPVGGLAPIFSSLAGWKAEDGSKKAVQEGVTRLIDELGNRGISFDDYGHVVREGNDAFNSASGGQRDAAAAKVLGNMLKKEGIQADPKALLNIIQDARYGYLAQARAEDKERADAVRSPQFEDAIRERNVAVAYNPIAGSATRFRDFGPGGPELWNAYKYAMFPFLDSNSQSYKDAMKAATGEDGTVNTQKFCNYVDDKVKEILADLKPIYARPESREGQEPIGYYFGAKTLNNYPELLVPTARLLWDPELIHGSGGRPRSKLQKTPKGVDHSYNKVLRNWLADIRAEDPELARKLEEANVEVDLEANGLSDEEVAALRKAAIEGNGWFGKLMRNVIGSFEDKQPGQKVGYTGKGSAQLINHFLRPGEGLLRGIDNFGNLRILSALYPEYYQIDSDGVFRPTSKLGEALKDTSLKDVYRQLLGHGVLSSYLRGIGGSDDRDNRDFLRTSLDRDSVFVDAVLGTLGHFLGTPAMSIGDVDRDSLPFVKQRADAYEFPDTVGRDDLSKEELALEDALALFDESLNAPAEEEEPFDAEAYGKEFRQNLKKELDDLPKTAKKKNSKSKSLSLKDAAELGRQQNAEKEKRFQDAVQRAENSRKKEVDAHNKEAEKVVSIIREGKNASKKAERAIRDAGNDVDKAFDKAKEKHAKETASAVAAVPSELPLLAKLRGQNPALYNKVIGPDFRVSDEFREKHSELAAEINRVHEILQKEKAAKKEAAELESAAREAESAQRREKAQERIASAQEQYGDALENLDKQIAEAKAKGIASWKIDMLEQAKERMLQNLKLNQDKEDDHER